MDIIFIDGINKMQAIYRYIFLPLIAIIICSCGSQVTQVGDGSYKHVASGKVLEVQKYPEPSSMSNDVRVALLAPLSGEDQQLGQNALDATQLAIFDLQANHLHLIPIDTNLGIPAVLSRLEKEKVDLILGPVFSRDSRALHSYAVKNNINMISFSNDSSLLGLNHLFLLGYMPEQSLTHVLDYALRYGYDNIYAVLPKNKYGDLAYQAIKSTEKRLHFKLHHVERYIPTKGGGIADPVELAMAIRKVILETNKNLASTSDNIIPPRHLLLIPEGGSRLRKLIQQLHLLADAGDPKLKIVGSDQWDDPQIMELASLQGSWFAAPMMRDRTDFEDRFRIHFNYDPLKIASLAYDGLTLAAILAQQPGNKKAMFSQEAILNPDGFKGISGIFRFTPDGGNERAMAVFEIAPNGKVLEIEKAKETFVSE
jgi:ABC-type branched-subunit amino acid transport system substrate-binding protein